MKNKKEVPNCAICKWIKIISIILNRYEYCQAQGFAYVQAVYNNELCKKLYEKKDNPNENNK